MDDAARSDLHALAVQYGLPFVAQVTSEMLDPCLVEKLPVEWARAHALLPVRYEGRLAVLTADPGRISDYEYLSLLLEEDLQPVLASPQCIAESIETCYYNREDTTDDFLRDIETGDVDENAVTADDLLQVAEAAPITQLVNLILLEAVKAGASDIHIEPFQSGLRVRYRIDGILYDHTTPPKHLQIALVSRLKVMGRMDIAEKRLPQDGVARVRVGEREIDVRISTVPVAEGERVVLRLLDREAAMLPMADLGMAGHALETFRRLLTEPSGILLITGPTGSGKTTTLYAALNELDATRRNIITIEDPIEYQVPRIGQMQVNPKIGLTFATGLRHILRQDPDVVLVGETRDFETAEIAVKASLTGHLVFSTLHTNDAPSAVLRLADMGIEAYLLAASLRGVLAQRLARRLCVSCSEMRRSQEAEIGALGAFGRELDGLEIPVAKGCPDCREGYRGRLGLFELMEIGPAVRGEMREAVNNVDQLRRLAIEAGMVSLLQDGVSKIRDGQTTVEEIVDVVGYQAV